MERDLQWIGTLGCMVAKAAQPTLALAPHQSQNRGSAVEEGQGEALNSLELFHTPTGIKGKLNKINCRCREEKNVTGFTQLSQ